MPGILLGVEDLMLGNKTYKATVLLQLTSWGGVCRQKEVNV